MAVPRSGVGSTARARRPSSFCRGASPAVYRRISVCQSPDVVASGSRGSSFAVFHSCHEQLSLSHNHGFAAEHDPISLNLDVNDAPSCRSLIADHRCLAEPLCPIIGQTAVGRSRHRVFVDSGSRCKEARNKVEPRVVAFGSDDDSATFYEAQLLEVRAQAANDRFRCHFHEVVEPALADMEGG
jgi:hypothetical protein